MKIVKGTFAPTYSGVWSQFSSASFKLHKFWFHVNDMNCCARGTMHKYMLVKPTILESWHVQKGTNLTQDEIKPLDEASFIFNEQSLFICLKKPI